MTRQELIEALETATEPNLDLDIEIANQWKEHHSGRWGHHNAPAFTRSIDAALALVPEGYGKQLCINIERGDTYCQLSVPAEKGTVENEGWLIAYNAHGLAACAVAGAALRAREE